MIGRTACEDYAGPIFEPFHVAVEGEKSHRAPWQEDDETSRYARGRSPIAAPADKRPMLAHMPIKGEESLHKHWRREGPAGRPYRATWERNRCTGSQAWEGTLEAHDGLAEV